MKDKRNKNNLLMIIYIWKMLSWLITLNGLISNTWSWEDNLRTKYISWVVNQEDLWNIFKQIPLYFFEITHHTQNSVFLWCVWLSHIQIWFNDLHDLLMNKIVNWTRFMLKHHFVWDDFSRNEWKPLWHQYHISIFNLTVHFS